MAGDKKWIVLKVGGTAFHTTRSTLIRSTPSNSPLHKLSSNTTNVQWDRDQDGAYLIDRDPVYFAPVLNFLRHGNLVINKDISEEGVLVEAEYFNLPELAKAVRARMMNSLAQSRQFRQIPNAIQPHFGFPGNQSNYQMCDPFQTQVAIANQCENYINELLSS